MHFYKYVKVIPCLHIFTEIIVHALVIAFLHTLIYKPRYIEDLHECTCFIDFIKRVGEKG